MTARSPPEAMYQAVQVWLDPQGWLWASHNGLAAPPLRQEARLVDLQKPGQAAPELPGITEAALTQVGHQ